MSKRKRTEEEDSKQSSITSFFGTSDGTPSKNQKSKKSDTPSASSSADLDTNAIIAGLEDPGWKELLESEFQKPYFKKILSFVEQEREKVEIYPPDDEVLNAFNYTPWDQVKVVIVGQDPYFNPGQAHGISFSVKKGVAVPPSLRQIYKELATDIEGFVAPKHGYLEEWARQGVLMINATLTVRVKKPNSHAKCGWQEFTDRVIDHLNTKKEGLIFLLWGKFAQKKCAGVDGKKHHLLMSAHPSPMAGTSFLGCKHFSKTNELLEKMGKEKINWNLSS